MSESVQMGKMNQDCDHQTKQLTSAIGGLQVMSRLQMGGQEVFCPEKEGRSGVVYGCSN